MSNSESNQPYAKEKKEGKFAYLKLLASGLAHEIRTPLSTLSINLQLLKEDLENSETPKERRIYNKILILLKETKRLEEILSDFLRFAGDYKMSFEERNINNIIDEVLEFLSAEREKLNIRIVKYYDNAIPLVRIDRNLFKQAIFNIIINAFQAMEKGGELTIRTSSKNNFVNVDIIDSGPGIKPEFIDKVFDVYFSTKKTGTGLGLATTKRIIEEHNGKISVQSEVNKGTCFTIELPCSLPVKC